MGFNMPKPSPRYALYVDAMMAAMPAKPCMVLARSRRLASYPCQIVW